MPEYVSQRLAVAANKKDAEELRVLLESIVTGVRALAAKLDADAANAALNDTNYAAVFDTYVKNS